MPDEGSRPRPPACTHLMRGVVATLKPPPSPETAPLPVAVSPSISPWLPGSSVSATAPPPIPEHPETDIPVSSSDGA